MSNVFRNGSCGIALVLLIASLWMLARHNLGYTGMWWDEAAQFWISQGLSNYAQPHAAQGGLADVIRYNRSENLDPGGFSLLLHFWAKSNRELTWLRLFPFLFLLLGIGSLSCLAWRVSGSIFLTIGSAAVPLLYPGMLYFGFEIRAYSMEMAGIALSALILWEALNKPSYGRAWLLGLTCALFLTSRYSYALSVAALCGVYGYLSLRRQRDWRSFSGHMIGMLVPVLIVASLIGWIMLRQQLWSEMKGAELGVAAPIYTRASVLRFTSDPAPLLVRNLFAPAALPLTSTLLFYLLLRGPLYRKLAARIPGPTLPHIKQRLNPLYLLILSIQVLSIAASALGYYPWDLANRWSAYLLMVSALAVITFTAECVLLTRHLATPGTATPSRYLLQAGRFGTASILLVAALTMRNAVTYRQTIESEHRTNVASQIDNLPVHGLPPQSVFVAFYEVPMLRYLYEYGPYAGRVEYPSLYRFEMKKEWRRKIPILTRGSEDLAFIISAYTEQEAQVRFPRSKLRPVGPEGSRLLAIDPLPIGTPSAGPS